MVYRNRTPGSLLLAALLLVLSALVPTQSSPAGEEARVQRDDTPVAPTPFSATYKTSLEHGLRLRGTATRTLHQQSDGNWILRINANSFIASIEESVIFQWKDNRVVPMHYHYRLSGWAIRNRSNTIDFNWEQAEAYGDFRGRKVTVPLREGALDPLGFQQQLLMDLKAGKKEMVYQVVEHRGYDESRFAVMGEEEITNAAGDNRAIRLEKIREDSKRETVMWFAPELGYILIRLLQVEPDGTRYVIDLDDPEFRSGG